jgi:hypothetical protein
MYPVGEPQRKGAARKRLKNQEAIARDFAAPEASDRGFKSEPFKEILKDLRKNYP